MYYPCTYFLLTMHRTRPTHVLPMYLLPTYHVQDTPYSESLRAAADTAPLFDSLRIGGREVGAPGLTLTLTLTLALTLILTLTFSPKP